MSINRRMGKKNHDTFIQWNATGNEKNQLLINNMDEYQNNYALRSQIKKRVHGFDFV